jgi:hypothetical protein
MRRLLRKFAHNAQALLHILLPTRMAFIAKVGEGHVQAQAGGEV